MQKFDIKLSMAENVKQFVNIVNKYGDMVSYSISNRTITLEVQDADANPDQLQALLADIQPFLV